MKYKLKWKKISRRRSLYGLREEKQKTWNWENKLEQIFFILQKYVIRIMAKYDHSRELISCSLVILHALTSFCFV